MLIACNLRNESVLKFAEFCLKSNRNQHQSRLVTRARTSRDLGEIPMFTQCDAEEGCQILSSIGASSNLERLDLYIFTNFLSGGELKLNLYFVHLIVFLKPYTLQKISIKKKIEYQHLPEFAHWRRRVCK